jgi:mRNA interferase RelE/StbE
MGLYRIVLKPSVEKDFRKLDKNMAQRILNAIESLSTNPFPSASKKLVGSKSAYRVRIGDYRIIYIVSTQTCEIEIQAVKHRKDVYR